MHTVKARPITVEDVEVGKRVLISHGVATVPGEIINVRTKECRKTERVGGPVIATGTETHYGTRTDTGTESGGSFLPPWRYESDGGSVERPRERGLFVEDPDGEDVPVLDYIGCTTAGLGLNVFVPGETDPEIAAKRVREALASDGLQIVGDAITCRPVTEQRVVIYDGVSDERKPLGTCYEHESSTISKRSVYTFDYLPVGAS